MYCIVHRATYRICTRTRTVDSSNQASPAHASALSKRFLNSLASLANALLRYVVLGRHSSSSFRAYFLCSARHSLRSLPLYFRCSDPRWGWGGLGEVDRTVSVSRTASRPSARVTEKNGRRESNRKRGKSSRNDVRSARRCERGRVERENAPTA